MAVRGWTARWRQVSGKRHSNSVKAVVEPLEPRLLLDGALPAFESVDPYGSGVYRTTAADEIEGPADGDNFTFDVDQAGIVSLRVCPEAGFQPVVELFDGLDELASATATAAGRCATISNVTLPDAGTYSVVVRGASQTTGSYDLEVVRGAGLELDAEAGAANDSFADAEDIDPSNVELTDTAGRLAVVGQLPLYVEDFEGGTVTGTWDWAKSDDNGRIRGTDQASAARGHYALWMDRYTDGGVTTNEGTWTVDLSGVSQAYLHFSAAEYGDSEDDFDALGSAGRFTDTAPADGIAISADGVTWYPVWNAVDQAYAQWEDYTVDLSAAADEAGIALGADFQIRFQQTGSGTIPTGGRGWDDVHISTRAAPDPVDWFVFSLDESGAFSAAASALDGGEVELDVYTDAETRVATSDPSPTNITAGLDQVDAAARTVAIRVRGTGQYNLAVTTQSAFDLQPNAPRSMAQEISKTGIALGGISGGEDHWYAVAVNAGDELTIETFTPFGDSLDPSVVLFDPNGAFVDGNDNGADDGRNALLTRTAAETGTYKIGVTGAAGTGEFAVAIDGATGERSAFTVKNTVPTDEEVVSSAPEAITVKFTDSLAIDTVEAGDLLVNGRPATDVTFTDHETAVFRAPTLYGSDFFTVAIAAGAVESADGRSVEAYEGIFKVGPVGPRVIESSIQQGKTLATGDLTYTAVFDHPMAGDQLDIGDVVLTDSGGTPTDADSVSYDEDTRTVTVEFTGLAAETYTLRLKSQAGAFEDIAGADLDGETPNWPIPSYQSGDGIAGGDFTVSFALEDLSTGRPEELSFGGGTAATYYDVDGDAVTITLSGPGVGTVSFAAAGPAQLDAGAVELFGTSQGSRLSIRVEGQNAETSVLSIYAHGHMGGIYAPQTQIRSGVWVEGGLASLRLGDLRAGAAHSVEINIREMDVNPGLRMHADFDEVAACDFDTGGIPLARLTATTWEDGEIVTPWVHNVYITGDRDTGVDGDFGADLTLSGADGYGFSIWRLEVDGTVTDSNVDGSSGIVHSVRCRQWNSGSLDSRVLRSLVVSGDRDDPTVPGNFGADMEISGSLFEPNTLGRTRIEGELTGGTWAALGPISNIRVGSIGSDWTGNFLGPVHNIRVDGGIAGTINAYSIRSIRAGGRFTGAVNISRRDVRGASLRSFRVGGVEHGTLTAENRINSIRADEWIGGSISASQIRAIRITGERRSGLAGDFDATLTITGSDDRGDDLRSVYVAGNLGSYSGSDIDWTITGSVGQVRVRGIIWGWAPAADDRLRSVRAEGLFDSNVEADWAGSVGVDRDMIRTVLTMNGSRGGVALRRLRVGGQVEATTLDAENGELASVVVGQWTGGSITAGSARRIVTRQDHRDASVAGDFDTTLNVTGELRTLGIDGDATGTWTAAAIRNARVDGDISEVILALTRSPGRREALTRLRVDGWIDGSQIITPGDIGGIRAGGVRDSVIFTGVETYEDVQGAGGSPDDVLDLPEPGEDIYLTAPAAATIRRIRITGDVASVGFSLINSNFAAARIRRVHVAFARTDNDDVPFGFAADTVERFTYEDNTGRETWRDLTASGDSLQGGAWGDMEVRIV